MELRKIHVYTEVTQLSQLLALPRVPHIEVVKYHTDVLLNKHDNSRIIFDQTAPISVPPANQTGLYFMQRSWTESAIGNPLNTYVC